MYLWMTPVPHTHAHHHPVYRQPHINLVFPFVELGVGDLEADLEAALERACAACHPFQIGACHGVPLAWA